MQEIFSNAIDYIKDKLGDKELVFLFTAGSHSYGLSDEASDYDLNGIYIPSIDGILGIDTQEQFNFQYDYNGTKVEGTIYDIRKAIKLMLDNNPNMLDYLYCDESSVLLNTKFDIFRQHRDKFLGKRIVSAYKAYAIAQTKRIDSHRQWLIGLEPNKPNRSDFGLTENDMVPNEQRNALVSLFRGTLITDSQVDEIAGILHREFYNKIAEYFSGETLRGINEQFSKSSLTWLRTFKSLGNHLKSDSYELASKELNYIDAKSNYDAYNRWKANRNPKRALLEEKVGYDAKHASHVIRLLRQAYEIQSGMGVIVDRRIAGDADEILSVKRGNISYNDYLFKINDIKNKIDNIKEPILFNTDHTTINDCLKSIIISKISN